MKNKVIKCRVTEDQFAKIKQICGPDMSAWMLQKMLGEDVIKTKDQEPIEVIKEIVEVAKPRRCMAPYCKSMEAKEHLVQGMKAFLCDIHKP